MQRTRANALTVLGTASLLMTSCHATGPAADDATPAAAPDSPAQVVVLATGGTIAATHDAQGAVVPTVTGEELVDAVRGDIADHVEVEVRQIADLDSSAMTLSDTDEVLSAIENALGDAEVAGVVVTHGTDSMEESAMAADIFHTDPRPVVFTGAMKTFDDPDPDGPRNLADAINAAADPENREEGAFISFGGGLIPARGAYKQDTESPHGFATNAPEGAARPAPRERASLADANVWTIAAFPGAPRELVDSAVEAGARGIVVEAMGAGNVGTAVAEAIRDALHRGVTVAMSTRVPQGPVVGVYGGAGGAATLFEHGVVGTGYLRPAQARIALAAALATNADPADVFAGYQPGAD